MSIFRKSVVKIQVDQCTFLIILRSFLVRKKDVSDKSCRGNQNTHCIFSNRFSFFRNSCLYEIIWKNAVELERLQMTTWRMRLSRWVPTATNTHSRNV